MNFRPEKERYSKEHEKRLYEIIRSYPDRESIEFTDEIYHIVKLVVSIVLVKNRWMDAQGNESHREADDLVQHALSYTPRILKNMWDRLHNPDNPIKNSFSYLCASYQNKMIDYIRHPSNDMVYVDEIQDYSDRLVAGESHALDEVLGKRYLDVYTHLHLREIRSLLEDSLYKIPIRLRGKKKLAFYWLARCFLKNYEASVYDLWPFASDFSESESRFVYSYFEIQIRKILYKHHLDLTRLEKV
jgi:DNA-directed RNA polymerase specialized sigma24 family protein